jgi:hypothetical protein
VGRVIEPNTSSRDIGRTRPRGYADWTPRAQTLELLDEVQVVIEEYEDHLPITVRQIFYRLVATIDYEKTERAYDRLREHLVRARRAQIIPFDAIRDDGVVSYSPEWYDGVQGFWDDAGRRIRDYRRDRQTGQTHRFELWCESAGMAPQLARVASEFSIPVFSAGGFVSLSAVRQIVDRAADQNVPTVMIHVGDFDPSGESIFESMAADAVAFLEEDRLLALQKIIPIRIALTAQQVKEHELPTAPAKTTDSRSARWQGGTCQLEALAPDVLAQIVHDEITSGFRDDVLVRQIEQEERDRKDLRLALPRGSA